MRIPATSGMQGRRASVGEDDLVARLVEPEEIRVLIVDDDHLCVSMFERILAGMGISVETAFSLLEAEGALARQYAGFHVVLLDYLMGDGLGTELLDPIRRHRRPAKVLLISGLAKAELVRHVSEDDVFARINKPVEPAELRTAVRRAAEAAVERWRELQWSERSRVPAVRIPVEESPIELPPLELSRCEPVKLDEGQLRQMSGGADPLHLLRGTFGSGERLLQVAAAVIRGCGRFTAAEAEILDLFAQGYDVDAIADRRATKVGTVHTHMTNIGKKIAARNPGSLLRLLAEAIDDERPEPPPGE